MNIRITASTHDSGAQFVGRVGKAVLRSEEDVRLIAERDGLAAGRIVGVDFEGGESFFLEEDPPGSERLRWVDFIFFPGERLGPKSYFEYEYVD